MELPSTGIGAGAVLDVVGDPIGPVLACTSTDAEAVDIGGVGDAMDDRGWHLSRLVDPPGLTSCSRLRTRVSSTRS